MSKVIDEILINYWNGTINPDSRKWLMDKENDLKLVKQSLAIELVRMLEEALGENQKINSVDEVAAYKAERNKWRNETRTRLTAIIERELK